MNKSGEVMPSKKVISQKTLTHMGAMKSLRLSPNLSGEILSFVVKIAALEMVRRLSKERCPILWRFVQAFQVFSYPPFKWLQKWGPLRLIVGGAQKVSRPLLVLSIATAFSVDSSTCRVTEDGIDDSQPSPESLSRSSTSDDLQSQESSKDIVPDSWLCHLLRELEKKGISLPERFNEDELRRFYTAANGDLECLVPSLVKTIRWRQTYHILSIEELDAWSHLVFWHGVDVILQPFLVIRLGLACSTLASHDRPRFAQAIVSQIDHGITNLTYDQDSQITVLMDCDGLSPFSFPMNMLRTCAVLVQDHFPNRLRTLFILRLPPVVRVLTQTFIQVLRPATRKKLRILGENTPDCLSEFLGAVPAFLGGDCKCSRCRMLLLRDGASLVKGDGKCEPSGITVNGDLDTSDFPATGHAFSRGCDHLLRAAIVGILMLWVVIAVFSGLNDLDLDAH